MKLGEQYNNKYRIPSARLKNWDYGNCAIYFVTICTKNREMFFGDVKEIASGEKFKMVLSDIGKIVNQEWLNTLELRKDMNITIGEFVVMPNHFHCVLTIGENSYNENGSIIAGFKPQSHNLASIIRGFKASVTKQAREIFNYFAWQPRFYDHIVRNEQEFELINNYIRNNPIKWGDDKYCEKQNKNE